MVMMVFLFRCCPLTVTTSVSLGTIGRRLGLGIMVAAGVVRLAAGVMLVFVHDFVDFHRCKRTAIPTLTLGTETLAPIPVSRHA